MNEDNKIGFIWGVLSSNASFVERGQSPHIEIYHQDKSLLDVLKSEYGGNVYGPYRGRLNCVWKIASYDLINLVTRLDRLIPKTLAAKEYKNWRKKNFNS